MDTIPIMQDNIITVNEHSVRNIYGKKNQLCI